MTRDEARKIFKEMCVLYPMILKNAEDKTEVAKTWIDKLIKGDYEKTKFRLNDFAYKSHFPPSLADIIVLPISYVDPDETYLAEARKEVAKELADPVLRKQREEKLNQFREKLKGMMADEYC